MEVTVTVTVEKIEVHLQDLETLKNLLESIDGVKTSVAKIHTEQKSMNENLQEIGSLLGEIKTGQLSMAESQANQSADLDRIATQLEKGATGDQLGALVGELREIRDTNKAQSDAAKALAARIPDEPVDPARKK